MIQKGIWALLQKSTLRKTSFKTEWFQKVKTKLEPLCRASTMAGAFTTSC